ncbi:hypothetical protein LXL04_008162 [Taraxacum kok-saghyz]
MYAVGKLSSYISQGVYTVSGPFHPFGGAVDMVVVQQQDGSLKSSPWYVRFGKFQGVLKAKERIVDINVNGVDAGFNMYLDPRGEAYFLREIDSEEEVVEPVSSHLSMCEEIDGKNHEKITVKSKSMNYDFDHSNSDDGNVLGRNNSKRSRILGFVLGRRSMNEQILSKEENDSNSGRIMEGEIAADLLEMKWSTNFSSRNSMNKHNESRTDNGEMEITGGRLEGSLVLHEQHFVNKLETSRVDDETTVATIDKEEKLNDHNEVKVGIIKGEDSLKIVTESCTEVASNHGDNSVVVSCSTSTTELNEILPPLESEFQDVSGDPIIIQPVFEQIVEEQFIFTDVDDSKPKVNNTELKVNPPPVKVHPEQLPLPGEIITKGVKGNIRRDRSVIDIPMSREITQVEVGRHTKSLPNMWSNIDDPMSDNLEDSQFYSPVTKFRSSNWDLVREDASRIIKANLKKELSQNVESLTKDLKDGHIASGGDGDGVGGSWSLWPFRRLGSRNASPKEQIIKKDPDVDIAPDTDGEKETSSPSLHKHTRALTPTPEQLASLNLSEGKNTVTFTFSTSVLGPQKVDASIYLWRWDTRIVISDVDGTITKSDVLGQFMPLVGRDWSHIGVTHLFSGIKENGYQMLYLSARAISQASITRQFLFNLKQDGKALPDGPVVISPDGLFPSLFREVIRRAPHEFKIACLEIVDIKEKMTLITLLLGPQDIKSCFPADRNPFYAGFGNRDTDEFSYLKVGISKGKIFIINPKGEVVVNRCIDSKSYASLHALVNGIFPPISVHEEEDYNSWNFWKLPPPNI